MCIVRSMMSKQEVVVSCELRLIAIPTEMCRRITGAARAQCVTYL